jgi:NAD dependent epimerase/dehydratase family enzyme
MRILISGAAGLLGSALTRALRAEGDEPVALVRRPARSGEVQWDPKQPLDPAKLADCDAVVHLAGKNIAGLWTKKFKQEVLESRVGGTRTLATAAAESYRQSGKPQDLRGGVGHELLRGSRRRVADGGIVRGARISG